jgi:hypothetical protein
MAKKFDFDKAEGWICLSDILKGNYKRTKYAVVLHVNKSLEPEFPWRNGEIIWFERCQEKSEELDCQVISDLFVDNGGVVYGGYSTDNFRVVPDSEILRFSMQKKML